MSPDTESFRSFELDNGMRVNLVVNRSAPIAEVHFYVRTGYAWESDALQGVSHVVEHNLMHASHRRPGREDFSRDRRSMGAWYDAGTTYDYTEYLMIVPARHLKGAMEMLEDGFFSPVFSQEVFTSEMGAILQESKRKEDIPEPMVLEKLYATAYKVHRRGRWRLGTEESLARIRLSDLRTYFQGRYGPGNIACTVGGDIDLDEVEAWVRDIFGKVPAHEVVGEDSPVEPVQEQVRYSEIPSKLARVYWICGFHVPAFLLEDGYHVFDILAAVLGGGRGSRLVQRIQDKSLVDRIEARAAEFDEYMMLNIYAETDAGRIAEAEEAILAEIFSLACHEVAPQELRRARTYVESQVLMRQDDLRQHVEWLAVCEGRGGSVGTVESYAELLSAASPPDLRKAAQDVFRPGNLSVCMLRPSDVAARSSEDVAAAAERAYKKAKESTAILAQGAESSLGEPVPLSRGILTPPREPVQEKLKNGTTLVFQASPGNPTFALAALLRGGRPLETERQAGLTALLTAFLTKGSQHRSANALTMAMEDLGVVLKPAVTDDAFGFTLYGPATAFKKATAILAEILTEPALDPDDLDREKAKLLSRLRGMADRPREYALELFRREMFAGHAYGLPRPGDADAIAGMDSAGVSAWHGRLLNGRNLILSLSADLETAAVREHFGELFRDLPQGAMSVTPACDFSTGSFPRVRKIEKDQSQTTSVVGFPGAAASSPDVWALDLIANFCLGDGGRFYDEIRGKRGLAYVVHAVNASLAAGGSFFGFSATAHDKAAEAQDIFLTEYRKLTSEMPDAEDLARTVEFCLGMRSVRTRRTSLQRVVAMADAEVRGVGYAWELDYEKNIRAVTQEMFLETAKTYFRPDGHVMVVVGPG
jgi:zinc protease